MKAIAIEIKNEAAKTRNEREGFQFLEMERNKEKHRLLAQCFWFVEKQNITIYSHTMNYWFHYLFIKVL